MKRPVRTIDCLVTKCRLSPHQGRCGSNMNNATRISVIQDRERWDLPRIINLNAWSLNIEKRDELQIIVEEFNVSIVCVTESWFKEYITDDCVAIDVFYCERKDRLDRRSGGVACYLRNSILYTRMGTLEDPSLEVMWLKIMPRKLPRRFSCIIVVCIYHYA